MSMLGTTTGMPGVACAQSQKQRQKRHDDSKTKERAPFLCFGKHTGYGGYGSWNRGSRIIELQFTEKNGDGNFHAANEVDVETWVRMENSGVVTRVTLNDTYGQDRYPTANGEPGS